MPSGTKRWMLSQACLAGSSAPRGSMDVMFTETETLVVLTFFESCSLYSTLKLSLPLSDSTANSSIISLDQA